MKRPTFLTIWLYIMLLLAIAITIDSLTYLHVIFLTKSYVSLLGIIAGFGQIWGLVQIFRWRKIGMTLVLTCVVIVFLVTAINELTLTSNLSKVLISLLSVLAVDSIILGILYLAIKPVWKNFK